MFITIIIIFNQIEYRHWNVNMIFSSINTSLISVLNVGNGAHFLNATSVLLPAVTVISPVTKINVSKQSQRLGLILSLSNFIELFRFY